VKHTGAETTEWFYLTVSLTEYMQHV